MGVNAAIAAKYGKGTGLKKGGKNEAALKRIRSEGKDLSGDRVSARDRVAADNILRQEQAKQEAQAAAQQEQNFTSVYQPVASTNTGSPIVQNAATGELLNPVASTNQGTVYQRQQQQTRQQSAQKQQSTPAPQTPQRTSPEVDPRTGKPYGKVEAAPQKNFYQRTVEKVDTKFQNAEPRSGQQISYFVAATALKIPKAAYNTGKNLINVLNPNPEKNTVAQTGKGLFAVGKEAIKERDPTLPFERLLFQPAREDPTGFAAQLTTDILIPTGAAKKISTFREVTTTTRAGARVATAEAELPGGVVVDSSKSQLAIESGRRRFQATVDTSSIVKPDIEGTRIRTEKTTLLIEELDKKGKVKDTYTGVARSETQIKETPTGAKTKSSIRQVTNIDADRAFGQTGRSAGFVFKEVDDSFISGTATEYSRTQKTTPVFRPQDLKYPTKQPKLKRGELTVARTETLLEANAPLSPKLAEAEGVQVRADLGTVPQRLTTTLAESRGGKALDKIKSELSTQGYKTKQTETGKTVVTFAQPQKQYLQTQRTRLARAPANLVPVVTQKVSQKELRVTPTNPIPVAERAVKNIIQADRTKRAGRIGTTVGLVQQRTRAEGKAQTTPVFKRAASQGQNTVIIPVQKQDSAAASALLPKSRSKAKQASRAGSRSGTTPQQLPALIQSPAQEVSQQPAQIQDQIQVPQSRTRSAGPSAPKPSLPPVVPVAFVPFKESKKPAGEQGFAVLVRRNKKFSVVSDEPLSEADALKLGADRVRGSAAASFKIQKISGNPRRSGREPNLQDFYKSRREPGVFVQKREERISTFGELRDITFKGVQTQRSKKKRGGFEWF